MKIICTSCNKALGEQTPFNDSSKIYAKSTDCLNKEREEAARFKPKPKPGEKQEITLKNGLKGILWVPANKKGKLSLGEIAVSGKRFYCANDKQDELKKYLENIRAEEVEVTFLHSVSIKLVSPLKNHKKKNSSKKKSNKIKASIITVR